MKHRKLRLTFAIIISLLIVAAIAVTIYLCYHYKWNSRTYWLVVVLSIFFLDAITSIALFNSKTITDESKSFWLFIILVVPWCGFIFYIFLGTKKDRGFTYGVNNQTILLSAILKAKKSIKIYTNSLFFSYDTERALNLASWKNVSIQIISSFEKKKWKRNDTEFVLKQTLEHKAQVRFTNKQINSSFIIFDDEKVLLSETNFNYKYMYSPVKIYKTTSVQKYLDLWNEDIVRTTLFTFDDKPAKWHQRLKYGMLNIFQIFF